MAPRDCNTIALALAEKQAAARAGAARLDDDAAAAAAVASFPRGDDGGDAAAVGGGAAAGGGGGGEPGAAGGAEPAGVDYSTRVGPALRVSHGGRDLVLERYAGETAAAAAARLCAGQRLAEGDCAAIRRRFECAVGGGDACDAPGEGGPPRYFDRAKAAKLLSLAAAFGAVALQHR